MLSPNTLPTPSLYSRIVDPEGVFPDVHFSYLQTTGIKQEYDILVEGSTVAGVASIATDSRTLPGRPLDYFGHIVINPIIRAQYPKIGPASYLWAINNAEQHGHGFRSAARLSDKAAGIWKRFVAYGLAAEFSTAAPEDIGDGSRRRFRILSAVEVDPVLVKGRI